ncbi:MAG: hypothetical protein ACWA45_06535 [Flavobacteriales bacterium]
MGLYKILKIVSIVLSVLGAVFLAIIISKGDETVIATGEGIENYMYIAYITFAIALLLVIIFVLKGVFAGDIKKTLLTVGLFLAVIIISYVLADGSTEGLPLVDKKTISESASKWAGTGLYAFYILLIGAIGSMVFSGIKKINN